MLPHRSEDPMAQLLRWNEQIKALPEPLAYIVLDHSMTGIDRVEERDGRGKKFLRVSPAVLDEIKHCKAEPTPVSGILPPALTGIPLYRREDMPEGWPY